MLVAVNRYSLYEGLPAIFYDRIRKRSHWGLLKGERVTTDSGRVGEIVGVRVNQNVVAIRVRFGTQEDRCATTAFARFRSMSLSAASAAMAGLTDVLPTLPCHDTVLPAQEAGQLEPAQANPINGATDAERMATIHDVVRRCGIEFLYHMTDLENVPTILERGVLAHHKAPPHVDISLPTVQARREARYWGGRRYDLHEYACLYFNPRNAMLCRRREMQDRIALVKVSPKALALQGTLVSDGNAAAARSQLVDLDKLHTLDWGTILGRAWGDDVDGRWVVNEERKSQMMAETLVPRAVPVDMILGLACNCRATAVLLREVAGNTPVTIESRLYF